MFRDGYRIEKIRYESRPGVLVTAHLYLSDSTLKLPVVVRTHGHWPEKKSDVTVQAGAISLALSGFACLVIESPGFMWDDNAENERRELGSHEDWFLSMGSPVQGQYVWDVLRALDYVAMRDELDPFNIGVTGEDAGGIVAMYAYALDERIKVAVPVASAASLEINPFLACLCNHVPGLMSTGDRSDLLDLRAPEGRVLVMAVEEDPQFPIEGHLRTDEKLRRIYKGKSNTSHYRFERFFGGHDYNRRMRETALSFFCEHLQGGGCAPYKAEPRPLTDGRLNPYPAGTEDPQSPEFLVTSVADRGTLSFRDLLNDALASSAKEPYRRETRIAPWRKYGSIPDLHPGGILAIHDEGILTPQEGSSVSLPVEQIDQRLCILLGFSVAEVFAQLLHVYTPGGPQGWEVAGAGLAGDAFTSMLASVKTLVSQPEAPPLMIVAEGPVASLTARFFAAYRPEVQVQASHIWTSWREALDQGIRQNAQPLARYLEWI